MLFARNWGCQVVRGIAKLPKSHYDSLGVKSTATHAEIKTAYYEMSKLYHPDTNKGSEESLTRFRQITDAYEILGNTRSRKLYDKGLIVGGSGTILREEKEKEDDPTTRFYRQREKRNQVPTPMSGETVYDFDAWARAHYVHSKDRRQEAKSRLDHKMARIVETRDRKKVENLIFIITIFILSVLGFNSVFISQTNDYVVIDGKDREKAKT